MIRLIQRRLIVPRGDTGTFSIPMLAGKDSGDAAVFTVFDPLTHRKIAEKVMTISNGTLTIDFTHGDTVNLPVGQYVWDIKFYNNPVIVDEKIVDGDEIDSYYAAFNLPVCEIRETGDDLLMDDNAPAAKLAPGQVDYITAAITEIQRAKDAAASSAADADTSAINAENSASAAAMSASAALDSQTAAAASQQGAAASESHAAASASSAAASATTAGESADSAVSSATSAAQSALAAQNAQAAAESASSNATTQATNASASAQAAANSANSATSSQQAAANSATAASQSASAAYSSETNASASATQAGHSATTAQEAAAQAVATAQAIHEEIPTQVSQLENDAGYLTQHQDISMKANSADLATVATSGEYSDLLHTPTNVSAFTNDAGYLTQHQDISGKANSADLATVAISGSYNDLSNKPFIPSAISDLTDDSGHYTKPENGIPASDLEETYLTSFTETDPTVPSWAKAAQKPSYTAAEVGAPTTQEMNTAIATAIGNVHQFDIQVVQSLPVQDIQEHTVYFVPKTGETNDVYDEYIYVNNGWEMIGNTQIDLSNYVQKNAYATSSTGGIIKVGAEFVMASSQTLRLQPANTTTIKNGTSERGPISVLHQHEATFYGLAKAAGHDEKDSTESLGTYTDGAKAAIQNMLGITNLLSTEESSTATVAHALNSTFMMNGKLHRATAAIAIGDAVVVGTNCEVVKADEVFVKKTDIASSTKLGIVKSAIGDYGIQIRSDGEIRIYSAFGTDMKGGTLDRRPLTPKVQHESAFYGLSKAAGVDLASETVTVGIYPETSKTAIQSMLDVPSNIALVKNKFEHNFLYPEYTFNKDDFESGYWNYATKAENSQTLRVKYLIPVKVGMMFKYTTTATQKIVFRVIENENSNTYLFNEATDYSANDAWGVRYDGLLAICILCDNDITINDIECTLKFINITGNASRYGIVKTNTSYGTTLSPYGDLCIITAQASEIKSASTGFKPVTPVFQHQAVFYGLSKLAGVDLANETVTLGTYPEASKTAIRSLIGAGEPLDVQINGTSIISNGVANIPVGSGNTFGVFKYGNGLGLSDGTLRTYYARSYYIKTGAQQYDVIVPYNQHEAVFYGLAKVAGADEKDSELSLGTYSDNAKTAIRTLIGAGTPLDVQINGASIVSNGIANIPLASTSTFGVIKVGSGLKIADSKLSIDGADDAVVKAGTSGIYLIAPKRQHIATFYGLAKAAGVDMASSDNAIGTYTETAKVAIRSMLGATSSNVIAVQDEQPTDTDTKVWLPETEAQGIQVPTIEDMNTALAGKVSDVQINGTSIVSQGVANIPYGSTSNFGVIKIGGTDYGLTFISSSNSLRIHPAYELQIQAASNEYRPITPCYQKYAVFYGLASAAGDTTQKNSSNVIGTYTTEAKAAIHTMLGIDPASIAAQVDIPLVETVSGTTPTITGQPNVRYVCGEVSTITITPPASGSVDVIFESGSTATTMTVPSTVKWPAWFDAEALETNTTYEVLITDGIYGSVMTWAT